MVGFGTNLVHILNVKQDATCNCRIRSAGVDILLNEGEEKRPVTVNHLAPCFARRGKVVALRW